MKEDRKQELPDEKLETLEFIKKSFRIKKPDFKEMLHQCVQVLLEFGACPFITNASGDSPISRAAAKTDVINLQLMCSAKPSKDTNVNAQNENGQTALMTAVDSLEAFIKSKKEQVEVSVIKSLLNANANPNVKYDNGDTVLIKAIKMSYLPLVQSILENSIVAIDHGHQNNSMCYEKALTLQVLYINLLILDLQMALTIAAQLNNVEIVQLYLQNLLQTFGSTNTLNLNTFDEKLSTPLAYACRNGNFNAVKMMISLGANPNICKPQSIPLIEAVKSGNIQVVKLLLESGAVVTESDLHGNTALHNAVLVEKHRIVDLLLEYSANVHARNNKKQTPLHLAIERTKNQTNRSLRVEFSLIKKGADLNAIDFFGKCAPRLIERLLKY
jgi:ankyrin repeat protein